MPEEMDEYDAAVRQIDRLEAEVERLRAENFALAANQCKAGYSGERGDHMCRLLDALRKLRRPPTVTGDADTISAVMDIHELQCAIIDAAFDKTSAKPPPPDQPEGRLVEHHKHEVTCRKVDKCKWPECHCGPPS